MGFEIIVAFLSGVFCFLLCVLFCCAVGGSLSFTGLGGEFVSCCKSLLFTLICENSRKLRTRKLVKAICFNLTV